MVETIIQEIPVYMRVTFGATIDVTLIIIAEKMIDALEAIPDMQFTGPFCTGAGQLFMEKYH